eukprot:UN02012
MNRILCPLKSHWELATRTRLTTTAEGAILVITDFLSFQASGRIMGPRRATLNLTI